jgi:hypothetical protein
MKALPLIFIWALFGVSVLKAQSPAATPPAVPTISGSYYAFNPVDVYAFKKDQRSKLAPSSQIDKSIHFRLKKGDRFYVNSILNNEGTTLGYVITAWNYLDEKSRKRRFYDSLLNAKLHGGESLIELKTVVRKQKDTLEIISDKIKEESSELNALQASIAKNMTLYEEAARRLLAASLELNLTTNIPAADRKRLDVTSFFTAQSNLKSKQLNLDTDNKQEKDMLIIKALALSVNTPLDQEKKQYLTAQKNYENSLNKVNEKQGIIASETSNLNALTARIADKKSKVSIIESQNSQIIIDTTTYRTLKSRAGVYPDAPEDPASPYAPFADLAFVDSWANGWQFFMNADDFAANCSPIYPRNNSFTWGFLTLPLKLRFDNDKGGRFNFEQNLNFGLTFGIKHQYVSKNDISINYLAGISVVNVPLNNAVQATPLIPASGSDPEIPATPGSPATSTAGLSVSTGVMFQIDKFQIGMYIGKDFAGDHANQFVYQGKTWFGIAIGISLFGEGKTTAGGQTQE